MARPQTLVDLVEALTALLDPVKRARRCSALIDAAKAVLAAERHTAMLMATTRGRPRTHHPGRGGQRLHVSQKTVTSALRQAREAQAGRPSDQGPCLPRLAVSALPWRPGITGGGPSRSNSLSWRAPRGRAHARFA